MTRTSLLQRSAFAALSLSLIAGATLPAYASGGSGGGGGGGFGGGGSLNAPREAVDPVAAYQNGLRAYNSQNYNRAVREFRRVLTVDRRNPEANYWAGMSYIGLDKPKKALRYFRTASKARKTFVEAHEQYALTLVRTDNIEKARDHLAVMEGLSAGPALTASIERVRQAIDSGEVPDQLSLALAPTGDALDTGTLFYADAVRLINQEQYADAIKVLYDTQFQVGLHADIQNYLGYTHRKLGRYAEAKTYYARALKLNPDHLGAHEYLGELYLELGEMKSARKQLAKLDKLCSFGCAEREELARLISVQTVHVALAD